MKKYLVLGAIVSVAFISCKKDYTCECTANAAGVTSTSTISIKDTKKNAEEDCESAKASLETQYGTGTASCTLN